MRWLITVLCLGLAGCGANTVSQTTSDGHDIPLIEKAAMQGEWNRTAFLLARDLGRGSETARAQRIARKNPQAVRAIPGTLRKVARSLDNKAARPSYAIYTSASEVAGPLLDGAEILAEDGGYDMRNLKADVAAALRERLDRDLVEGTARIVRDNPNDLFNHEDLLTWSGDALAENNVPVIKAALDRAERGDTAFRRGFRNQLEQHGLKTASLVEQAKQIYGSEFSPYPEPIDPDAVTVKRVQMSISFEEFDGEHRTGFCTNLQGHTILGCRREGLENGSTTFAGVPADLSFLFTCDDAEARKGCFLYAVEVTFDTRNYQRVAATVTAKYGEASNASTNIKENRMGAEFGSRSRTWKFRSVVARIEQRGSKIDEGKASYTFLPLADDPKIDPDQLETGDI